MSKSMVCKAVNSIDSWKQVTKTVSSWDQLSLPIFSFQWSGLKSYIESALLKLQADTFS